MVIRKSGQMKIQQMAFMIVAVLIFFVLVGIFFINFQFKDVKKSYLSLEKEQAISSMGVIADMSELNCNSRTSFCLDEDKLLVMSGKNYDRIWPVQSVEVRKVYPRSDETIACPGPNCNYYSIYDSGQENFKKYPTFVSICKYVREYGSPYERCEIGKLIVGVKLLDEE